MPPSNSKLIQKVREAVQAYLHEHPAVGGSTAMEWAVTSRIAMHLGRSARVRQWEADEGIRVDAEYAQQGPDGKGKGRPGKWMKPDLIIHRRTELGRENNWLVVEFKMHDEVPTKVWHRDLEKLQRAKSEPFFYQLALWVSLPREPQWGSDAVYAEVSGEEAQQPVIRTLVRGRQ